MYHTFEKLFKKCFDFDFKFKYNSIIKIKERKAKKMKRVKKVIGKRCHYTHIWNDGESCKVTLRRFNPFKVQVSVDEKNIGEEEIRTMYPDFGKCYDYVCVLGHVININDKTWYNVYRQD